MMFTLVQLLVCLTGGDSHPASNVQQLTPRLWKQNFAENPLRSDLAR
jgi:hypothetical protein